MMPFRFLSCKSFKGTLRPVSSRSVRLAPRKTSFIVKASYEEIEVSRAKSKLEDLERERQEASERGTNLANKSKRLMQSLLSLQDQAFEAVKKGDEETARALLRSKAQVQRVLEGTTEKAKVNLDLAAKLEEAIGRAQTQLIALLAKTGQIRVDLPSASSEPSSSSESARGYEYRDFDEFESRSGPGIGSSAGFQMRGRGDRGGRSDRDRPPAAGPGPGGRAASGSGGSDADKLWEDPFEARDSLERKFQDLEARDLREKQARLERLWRSQGDQEPGTGPKS